MGKKNFFILPSRTVCLQKTLDSITDPAGGKALGEPSQHTHLNIHTSTQTHSTAWLQQWSQGGLWWLIHAPVSCMCARRHTRRDNEISSSSRRPHVPFNAAAGASEPLSAYTRQHAHTSTSLLIGPSRSVLPKHDRARYTRAHTHTNTHTLKEVSGKLAGTQTSWQPDWLMCVCGLYITACLSHRWLGKGWRCRGNTKQWAVTCYGAVMWGDYQWWRVIHVWLPLRD